MDVMSERVAWLREAMGHVRQLAEDAGSAPWLRHPNHPTEVVTGGTPAVRIDTGTVAVRRHVLTHEPRAVLARVEADRLILDLHGPEWVDAAGADGDDRSGYHCAACDVQAYPCPTVLALLAAYRHVPVPGFQEEWVA